MNGRINIFGVIGEEVSLVDIISQVKAQPEATSFDVFINSIGGSVDEGDNIYNYLIGLGVPFKTIGIGSVMSIATKVFLASPVRLLDSNVSFMIHNPWGVAEGDTDDIRNYADALDKVEKALAKEYSKATGIDTDTIDKLMKSETFMDAKKAVTLGFATGIHNVAKAIYNPKTNKMNSKIKNALSAIKAMLEGSKAEMIELKDGSTVNIMGEIAVGSLVTDEAGEPVADAVHELADGSLITTVGGMITEITAPEIVVEEDVEALKTANAALTAEIEELKAQNSAFESEVMEEMKALKAQITSKFVVKAAAKTFKKVDVIENKVAGAAERRSLYKK
jgi:ATP-dependent protease ClpP protease subunit